MRKVMLSLVAAVAIGAGFTMATDAHAAPLAPSALQPSIADTGMVEDIRWVRRCGHNWRNSRVRCYRVWRPHYWRWSRRW